MRQHKHLLDKSRCVTTSGSAVVVADADKIADERTDNKEGTAVHAGHRVINDNYPVLEYFI